MHYFSRIVSLLLSLCLFAGLAWLSSCDEAPLEPNVTLPPTTFEPAQLELPATNNPDTTLTIVQQLDSAKLFAAIEALGYDLDKYSIAKITLDSLTLRVLPGQAGTLGFCEWMKLMKYNPTTGDSTVLGYTADYLDSTRVSIPIDPAARNQNLSDLFANGPFDLKFVCNTQAPNLEPLRIALDVNVIIELDPE